MTSSLWQQHFPPMHRRYLARHGLDRAGYEKLFRVVSPLALPPLLPNDRLAIFAGSVDRMVPPEQPLCLARHWQVPVNWYPGGHLTFKGESAVAGALHRVAAAAGWESAAAVTAQG